MKDKYLTLHELCNRLSITIATGKNWLRLGKIESQYESDGIHYFDREYVDFLQVGLQTGSNKALKSRRNKHYVSGSGVYGGYVTDKCHGKVCVEDVVKKLKERNNTVTDTDIRMILGLCAIDLVKSSDLVGQTTDWKGLMKSHEFSLFDEIEGCGVMARLIKDILPCPKEADRWLLMNKELTDTDYEYQDGEDVLGLCYISLKDMGSRKAAGSYYTPTDIVRGVIRDLEPLLSGYKGRRFLDPCCGTGNFLIQLSRHIDVEYIYGNDIDPLSVSLARLNMALHFRCSTDEEIDILYSNITCSDFLAWEDDSSLCEYDIILGNPPWGSTFDENEAKMLRKKYEVARGKTMESSDMFVERAIKLLPDGGTLELVLPEAMLNVKAHSTVRTYIYNKCNIRLVRFLGDVFHRVQCPAVILGLEKCNICSHSPGTRIEDGDRSYEIHTDRNPDGEGFCFRLGDAEYGILSDLMNQEGCTTLKGQAEFALGIVTGDNERYVTDKREGAGEQVLRGSDIFMYRYNNPDRYIDYVPDRFQQTAAERFYRAPEKLLYRFVSRQLVFAYDDRQMLSLNSCNIVIPHVKGLSVKYILAVFNSRVARYIYRNKYHSMKVLRSHIESIPIPVVERSVQERIEKYVNMLLDDAPKANGDGSICDTDSWDTDMREKIYDRLDDELRMLYGLDDDRYMLIKKELKNERNLL